MRQAEEFSVRFRPIKQGSVKDRVVSALTAAIYSGKLKPGDPLLEIQLAREFQVSQTAVREALFHLEQIGLVRRIANKGTLVTQLSDNEVRERVELRRNLETVAAIQAAPHVVDERIVELQQKVEQISAAILQNDYFAAALSDLDFHRGIWLLSGNKTLYQVLDQIAVPMFAFISIVRSSRLDNLRRAVHSHSEILNALTSGSEKRIREAIDMHFSDSYERFLQPREAAPSEGSQISAAPTGS